MNTDGVAKFTPSRLVIARERRGKTQRELSIDIGVSDRMVKSYEAGTYRPSAETMAATAHALGFPVAFFEADHIDPIELEAASFRAISKATATLRKRTIAAGTLALEVHRYFAERFDLPLPQLPDLRVQSIDPLASPLPVVRRYAGPERAAEIVRHVWGLGEKPIKNVIHLLEAKGVRVFSLSEDCLSIDAFSIVRDGVPFVFLNSRKTAERSIFDAAHELGHLLLHQHGIPQGQDAENEADAFAAAFLLPESAMRASVKRMPTITSIAAMKSTWHASVQAIGFRLHELGLMTDWHYKLFNIELSKRGRENELAPLPRETSAIMRKAMTALAEEGIGPKQIALELHLPLSELHGLMFGLGVLDGGNDVSHRTGPGRPTSLRLVPRES